MHRIAVFSGAGYAGLPAVNRIARPQTYRDEVELVLVSARDRFVELPRLHQLAAGQPRPDLPLTGMLAPGVRLRVGRADRLADHALAFADGTELPYHDALYAPGSTIDVTSVPGVAEHAHTVAGPESALAIAAALRADPRARVVVVGGGLTGLELAAEVAESSPHADVTLVTAGQPGGWLSARAQAYVADALDALGVRRVTDTGSPALPQAGSATAAHSTCACGRVGSPCRGSRPMRDGLPADRTLRGRAATAYKNVVLDAGRGVSGHPGPVLRPRRRVAPFARA